MSRILVVEDDQQLRGLMERILERIGYVVWGVGTVKDALTNTGPWDLLILDRTLPNGDGARVAEAFPQVPTIVISGYQDADLRKPFNMRDLATMVTHRLRGGS